MKRIAILFCTLLCLHVTAPARSFEHDGRLMAAYLEDNMPVWKAYIDSLSAKGEADLPYEYGYCAALMAADKAAAKPYVQQFRRHVEARKESLPAGHYEMYMSAVYVYELRLHESFHPARSLSLAREAVKKAPADPLTLTYCGMSLFYAPAPFGDKKEALELFLKALPLFEGVEWYHCWWRAAAMMYAAQCYDKQGNTAEALRYARAIIKEYPAYVYMRDTYLPDLESRK